jgi:hypothetical protein
MQCPMPSIEDFAACCYYCAGPCERPLPTRAQLLGWPLVQLHQQLKRALSDIPKQEPSLSCPHTLSTRLVLGRLRFPSVTVRIRVVKQQWARLTLVQVPVQILQLRRSLLCGELLWLEGVVWTLLCGSPTCADTTEAHSTFKQRSKASSDWLNLSSFLNLQLLVRICPLTTPACLM